MARNGNGKSEVVTIQGWTTMQAYTLAVVCLLLGGAIGYLLRGSEPAAVAPAQAAMTQAPANMAPGQIPGFGGVPGGGNSPEMVDKAAQPMLEALRKNPKDSDTLAKVGNLYYDAQIYPKAIEYYQQALKITPGNAGKLQLAWTFDTGVNGLQGGGGNDSLDGGPGNDTLFAGQADGQAEHPDVAHGPWHVGIVAGGFARGGRPCAPFVPRRRRS